MISIFRRRRRETDSSAPGRNGKIRAPEQFSPIPCLDGLVWIEDGCLHKSGMDTSQSFRLPLTEVSDIVADWDFFKENPTRAETRIMVQSPRGSRPRQLRPPAVLGHDQSHRSPPPRLH